MALTGDISSPATGVKSGIFLLVTPALVIFLSSNFVNLGNLAFNMIFSRLMGPELYGDLALLLTIKLALLGLFGGAQMAVSQMTAGAAGAKRTHLEKALYEFHRVVFVLSWFVLPIIALALWAGDIGFRLGIENPKLIYVLLISTPFSGPLSLLRGYAFGIMHTGSIVISANVEMGVRLLGSIIFWKLGFGIEGCVVAIVLSIIAGWMVLVSVLPKHTRPNNLKVDFAWKLGTAALPFAMLQFAQIVSLDGDIFLAKSALPPEQAGFIAALSLFQRIQFFACFALASVLLPSVAISVRSNQSIFLSITPIIALFLAVAIPFLALVSWQPSLLMDLLVGNEFREASAGLWLACVSACAFTFSFLVATLMAALNDQRGIWLTVAAAAVQILLMSVAVKVSDANYLTLLHIKAATQGILCLGLCIFTVTQIRQRANSRSI